MTAEELTRARKLTKTEEQIVDALARVNAQASKSKRSRETESASYVTTLYLCRKFHRSMPATYHHLRNLENKGVVERLRYRGPDVVDQSGTLVEDGSGHRWRLCLAKPEQEHQEEGQHELAYTEHDIKMVVDEELMEAQKRIFRRLGI